MDTFRDYLAELEGHGQLLRIDDEVKAEPDLGAAGAAAPKLGDRAPALLFTDVVMPEGLNGRQLADEAVRRRPGLKVLFTTGYTRNAIVHNGQLDPGVNLITKPFTYAELATKVRTLLDR